MVELNDRLETRYANVEQIVTEREVFLNEAFNAGETTPTVKGTKERSKAKHHPAPSLTHQHPGTIENMNQRNAHHHEEDAGHVGHAATNNLGMMRKF